MNDLFGLNEQQRKILTKWYNENPDIANDLFFDCEMDLDDGILSALIKINYFDTLNSAVNDFIVNVLAKGK